MLKSVHTDFNLGGHESNCIPFIIAIDVILWSLAATISEIEVSMNRLWVAMFSKSGRAWGSGSVTSHLLLFFSILLQDFMSL